MKTIQISILALSLTLGLVQCKKSKTSDTTSTTAQTVITEDDAADIVASSTGSGAYGSTSITSDASQRTYIVSNTPSPCLYALDTTYTKTNATGSAITYSYNLHYKYQMYCTNSVPTDMIFQLSTSGSIDQPRISATSSSTGTLTINGLAASATSYTANGTYVRNGSATSKVRNKNGYSYVLNFSLNNLLVKKSDYSVTGGSETVSFAATTTTGKVYNFTGTLTYVNAATATLVIGTKTYTINIPASDVQ